MQQEKHLIFYIVFLCNTSISYILPFEEIINYQADETETEVCYLTHRKLLYKSMVIK